MKKKHLDDLSRRERQVLSIIYRLGQATAAEVGEQLPDQPSYSAVRGMLRVLEERGLLRHRQDGPRYVYVPTVPRLMMRMRFTLCHTPAHPVPLRTGQRPLGRAPSGRPSSYQPPSHSSNASGRCYMTALMSL